MSVKRTVQFPDEQYEELKKIADEQGIPVSLAIRKAVGEYIIREGEKVPRYPSGMRKPK